ncbi:MAG: hypothetical protein OXM58_11455 [Rhodospirillaceae bacterium]|nr:hypothetical protein [Rhodospirillaceae bacterium]
MTLKLAIEIPLLFGRRPVERILRGTGGQFGPVVGRKIRRNQGTRDGGPTALPNGLAGGKGAGRELRRGAPLPAGRRCAGDYF